MPGGIYLCQANKEVSYEKRPLFVIPTKVGIHNELKMLVLDLIGDWIPVCIRQSALAERVSPIRYSKRIFSWASAKSTAPAAFYELVFHADVSYFIILSRS